jgi:hypothetical protein
VCPLAAGQPSIAADTRGTDAACQSYDQVSKLVALKNYRRARGLCYKYGERWGKDHTCPATFQLHVVEELFTIMGADAFGSPEEQYLVDSSVESLCAISLHALSESVMVNEGAPSVLQLKGWLNGHQVLLLVDSGSTVSFVNRKLAASLSGITATPVPLRVKVANDRELVCNGEIVNC